MPLGAHLRRAREEQGVSQTTLARRIKMEPTNLRKVERGEKNLTVDTLRRIAGGLGMRLEVRLMAGGEPPTS